MNLSPEIYNASQVSRLGLQCPPTEKQLHQKQLPPYPVHHFPPVLKDVIQALHSNTQIPIEMIGNVVLAATSLTCQSLIEVIQPHTNMPEPCSLYLMTIAESGEGKTTINKQVMKPCYAFASELILQYEQQLVDYKHKFKLWKIRQQALESNLRQAIKKGYQGKEEEKDISQHAVNEPQRPARPTFIYEDTSLKALIEGLNEYPEAGFISDEAITFFKSYLKNNPGLLNKTWDGEVFDFRRADGEIYRITPRLTFSLMSQPGVFMDYLNKHEGQARSSGFMSRFLFAWGDSTIGSRGNTQEYIAIEHELNLFHDRISELLKLSKIALSDTAVQKKKLKLMDDALEIWKDNRLKIEIKMAIGHEWEHIRDIASKASSNTLRIAALFQFFYNGSSEDIPPSMVGCAIKIMDWYLNQASVLFYPGSERCQFEQDVCELHAWIMNRIKKNNGFAIPMNELEKYGPHRLRRLEKLTPVLNQLISQGCFGVIKMFSHNALYVTIVNQNGRYNLPLNSEPQAQCHIIQSRDNTKGRPYQVNIS